MRSPLQTARDDADHFRQLIPSSRAAVDVLAERRRQIEAEGWTADHDDGHDGGDLAKAAACYAVGRRIVERWGTLWPWAPKWWKPSRDDRRRDLVKAGALILAEIERLDRAPVTTPPAETGAE